MGVARFGTVKSLGTVTAAVFDLKTAQALFDKQGRYDSILVAGQAPASPAADVRAAVAAKVGHGAQVQTAAAHDRFTLDGLKQFIGIIKTVLLVFGGVAILVGAFTIFNTLSITVAQRTREFAMLRMVGAARRQVLGSVMIEALALGLGASIIGIAAGFGIAAGLNAIFGALDLSLPEAGTVFEARTAIVALLVGTLVTLIAGFRPARQATKIAPVAALRDADPAAAKLRLPARAVRAAASLLGRPAAAIGGSAGRLARRNAMRNPGRTAVTASALMIGVMLVTAVTVVANGLRQETKGTLNDRIAASHVITAQDGWSPMDPEIAQHAAPGPGRHRGQLAAPGRRPRRRREGDRQRRRRRDDRQGVRLPVEGRLQRGAVLAGGGRRGRRRGLGHGARPEGRRRGHGHLGEGRQAPADGARDRGLAGPRLARPRPDHGLERGVRHARSRTSATGSRSSPRTTRPRSTRRSPASRTRRS